MNVANRPHARPTGRRFARFCAVLVISSLGLGGVVADAGSSDPARGQGTPTQTAPTQATQPEAASFARERGISVDEAARRLAWQVAAPDLDTAAEKALGDAYGGLWIDRAGGDRLKLAVTGSTSSWSAVVARGLVATHELSGATDIVTVERSLASLREAKDWLGTLMEQSRATRLQAGLRVDLNAVQLHVPAGSLSTTESDLVGQAKNTIGSALVIATSRGKVIQASCAYPYCEAPLRAGIKITNQMLLPSGVWWESYCTSGFVARGNDAGHYYLLTAGHCGTGTVDDWSTQVSAVETVTVGPMQASYNNSQADAGIIRILDPQELNPRPLVYVSDGQDTTLNETYPITSDNFSVLGMRICSTGVSSLGSNCGYVTELDVTITAHGTHGDVTTHHLGRASNCVIVGDSGGPMYASNVAYGITVATTDGQCDTFYQGVRAAEELLNVQIVHWTGPARDK